MAAVDFSGREIVVGSPVAYATGSSSSCSLCIGVVLGIEEAPRHNYISYKFKIGRYEKETWRWRNGRNEASYEFKLKRITQSSPGRLILLTEQMIQEATDEDFALLDRLYCEVRDGIVK